MLPHLHNPIHLAIKYEEVSAFKANCSKFIITNDGTGGDVVAEYFEIPVNKLCFWVNGVETPPEVPPRNDGKIRIISMARLERWKRVDRIIKAFVPLPGIFGNVHLDIVGDGPERDNLMELAEGTPNIHFLGELPRKQALARLADSDVFITSNDYSNVSNSLLEAMAAGKCVVALDTGKTGEFVRDEENGFLVHNEIRLMDALSVAINDGETRKALGKRAKKYAEKYFTTWDERIRNEVAICEELMK